MVIVHLRMALSLWGKRQLLLCETRDLPEMKMGLVKVIQTTVISTQMHIYVGTARKRRTPLQMLIFEGKKVRLIIKEIR